MALVAVTILSRNDAKSGHLEAFRRMADSKLWQLGEFALATNINWAYACTSSAANTGAGD